MLSNFKGTTVKAYCRTLGHFCKYWEDNYKEEKPGEDHVQQYLLKRIELGKSWSTINADYSSLRKYFKVMKPK